MGCTQGRNPDKDAIGFVKNDNILVEEAGIEANDAISLMGVEISWALIEISVKCKHLHHFSALAGNSGHTFCVMSQSISDDNNWKEVSRTEIIASTGQPEWVKKFLINYHFESRQNLQFSVYDCKATHSTTSAADMKLSEQTLLGKFDISLPTLLSDPRLMQKGKLSGGQSDLKRKRPGILVRAEEVANTTDSFSLQLKLENAASSSSLLYIRPFFMISKIREDGSFVDTYKSEVCDQSDNNFDALRGPIIRLCNADLMRPLKISFFHWNEKGHHQLLGEFNEPIF
jgi:hypothetical protein